MAQESPLPSQSAQGTSVREIRLEIVRVPDTSTSALSAEAMAIGSSEGATLHIHTRKVSHHHLKLRPKATALAVDRATAKVSQSTHGRWR